MKRLSLRVICRTSALAGLIAMAFTSTFAQASGVLPETSTVIINEAEHGGSINVTNTEKTPVLLYTKIYDLADDHEPKLITTQPVARLEPGQVQRVRFVLSETSPLKVEHIKRVAFEGIVENKKTGSRINLGVRQDLPVIIVPASAGRVKNDLWSDLEWSANGNSLQVKNTGVSVVRLDPHLNVLPARTSLTLKKSYLLPGETLSVAMPAGKSLSAQQSVEFSPVTRYGFDVGKKTVPLNGKA